MESSSPPDEELHARVRQQEVVTELGQEALETDDLDQLMRDASVAVAETLGNEYCKVLELLPNGDEVFLRQGVGWQDGLVGSATVPTDRDSQAGYTLLSEEPVIVDDLRTEERFSGPELLTSHDVVSGISVVIGSVDDPWGVLGTHTTEQREFTEHDANFVKSVANVLASAIENQRTESELEEIYGRISDAFFALDEQWRFTHINERAHELINLDDQTLVGKHIWEEFPDAVERQFKPKYERAMHEQETVAFEEYYPDPLDTWFEVRAYPSESGLSVYFRTVTERKEREQELQQTERRFEAIFEDPNILVGLLDPDGTVRDINQTAMEYIDADLDAVTGELFWETPWWGEGDDVRADVREWTERAADGEYVDFEADLTRPDGQRYTLNGVFRPVTNDDGDVVSVVVSDRDVTERREYERQLEESEQRYRTIAESFPNGIVTLFDDDLQYTLAAGQGFENIPLAPDDVEGRTPREVWDDDVADALEPVLQGTLDGERDAVELSYVGREWVIYAVPITDESGDVFAGVTVAHDITDRKEAEVELKRVTAEAEEQKRFYETIISSTPDLVYAFDLDYRFTFANDAVLEMWGQTREESLGKTLREIGYEPWHAEMHEREIDEVIETKEPVRGEVEFPHVERGRRVYEYIFAPVLDDDGEVEAIAGTSRDVTDRRQAKEKLQKSKERFQALVTASSDVVYHMSPDWSQMHELEGKEFLTDTDEPISDWPDKYIHPDDRPRVKEAIDEAIQTKSTFELEYRVEQDDGSTGWTFSRAVPMLDEDGEIEGWMGMASDITDRKERERELTKYETIVETIDDGIYVKDESGEFTMVNDAYAELTGYDRDELLGADVSLVVDEEAIREAKAVRSKTADGDRTMEAMVETADGDSVPAEATFATIQTVEGEEKQVGVVRDITERKEQRRQLEESERRYRTLVEHFPGGAVGMFDEDLCYTAVGGQLVDETGITPEDRIGRRVSEIYPDELVDEVEPYFHAALDGESNSFEAEYYDRHLSAHTLPVRNGDGEVFAGMLVVQDVTEQKQREQSLEEAKAQLEAATEAGAIGTFEWHIQDDEMVTGPSFAKTFGIDPDAAREGLSLDQFISAIHEDDRERVERKIEEVVESCGEYEEEYRVQNADGEFKWVVARGHVECDDDGNPVTFPGALADITERKRTELALQRNRNQLESLFEVLPVGVVVAEADGQLVEANDTAREIWGGDVFDADSVDEYEKYPVTRADTDEPVAPEQMTMARVLDGEEVTEPDILELEATDGERRTVRAEGTPIRDESGQITRGVVTLTDITERREAQRKLEQSEQRYRTLAENFPSGAVSIYDDDLRFTLAQGSVLGGDLPSKDDIEGSTVSEVYPPDIAEDLDALLRAAVEDGETENDRFEFGGRNWRVWATPLRDSDGDVFAGLSFAQDVTERVEREAELERALDLLDKTERIADVGGWEIDMDTSDVFWTDHIFDLLEVTADEEPPLDEALDMYYEEDRQVVEDAIEEAMNSGDPFDVEVRLRTENGEMRWLRLQGAPETVDGEVVSLRGAAQDVTDRKQHEQQREELIDKLEESNERLEQFAYAASHDLQEPLRMVSSYLQLLESRYADDLDEDAEEYIDFAVDGADRMRDMIEGLLKYSRVDTHGDSFEPVDLNEVLADVREDLQVRIEESNAEITAESLPRVEGDEQQLRQVFQNLVDNAIEYSGDDPPRVDISAERNAEQWVVSIRDEGIGIDSEDAGRVFEVFQSLHTPDDHSGTGIGLALCERVVERHGGDIWVDSEPGDGSTFSFTLPTAGDTNE